jgi:hypothetical protein
MFAPITWVEGDMGVNDDEIAAEVPHTFKQLKDVGSVEMIEESRQGMTSELAVPLRVKCADVLKAKV